MKFHAVIIALIALIVASPARADDSGPAAVIFSTVAFAAGSEADYRITPRLGLRAEVTFATLSHTVLAGPLAAGGKARLQSGSALADVYPFKRGFHISAGVRFYGNRAWAIARAAPGPTYTVGGKTYSAAQIRTPGATDGLTVVTPMVTAGYAARLSGRLAFGIEAGALLRGSMEGAGRTVCTGATCSTTMAALEAERAGMSRDIGRLKAYPLAQVKLGLRF